jgi:hypothetical protein
MKKYLYALPALLVVFVALFASVNVFAKEIEPNDTRGVDVSTEVRTGMPVPGNADVKEMEVTEVDDDAMSEGEEHRSEVADAVHKLLEVSDRSGGIGDEVKEIANEQKDAHDDVADSMNDLNKRSGLLTFLIGTDFKNLGKLRSSLVTSENGIDRLMKAKEKANRSVSDEIDAQIAVLKSENEHAKEFIAEQEGKFSLFGWLVKMFAK